MQITRKDFGNDFKWGVSTAAFQIEGAHNIDGKGENTWMFFQCGREKFIRIIIQKFPVIFTIGTRMISSSCNHLAFLITDSLYHGAD
jgi:hypothetical protein